jgi:hypothetical protein
MDLYGNMYIDKLYIWVYGNTHVRPYAVYPIKRSHLVCFNYTQGIDEPKIYGREVFGTLGVSENGFVYPHKTVIFIRKMINQWMEWEPHFPTLNKFGAKHQWQFKGI